MQVKNLYSYGYHKKIMKLVVSPEVLQHTKKITGSCFCFSSQAVKTNAKF